MCHLRGHAPDKRERFGIYEGTDGGITVNCFNCGFMTGWKPHSQIGKKLVNFLTTLNVPREDIDRLRFEAFRESNDIKSKDFTLKGSITGKWKMIDEPPADLKSVREWLSLNCEDKDFLEIITYADRRNFLDVDKIYWSPDRTNFFNKRLVIPYFHNGEMVGWTGRLASDGKSTLPKYLSSMPPQYIYGLDNQRDYDRKYVIINEGIIDALVTDGVGVLHNKLHEDQAALIDALPGEKIFCPDRDKDGDEIIETAIEYKWYVAFPNWGRDRNGKVIKDAGHAVEVYGHLLTVKSIIESREKDSYNIRIKRKMDRVTYDY